MALLQVQGAELAMHLRGMADGALFMLQSALALATAGAIVLAVDIRGGRKAAVAAIVFLAAAAASPWLPPVLAGEALVPAVVLVLGVLVAAGFRLRGPWAWAALVPGGAAAGIAGGLQTATLAEAFGGLGVLFLFLLVGLLIAARVVVPPRLHRGATTARRMAGAWIAAVGGLLIALWLRGGG